MVKTNTEKKLTAGMVTIMILGFCLFLTTFALIWASLRLENHLFHTGMVEVNLNDGQAIIHEDEFLFEPGMTVVKDCFIENKSTVPVYYKLYFEEVAGGLGDVIQITIREGEQILYTGTANGLSRQQVVAADDFLKEKEKKTLQVWFYFPPERGNDTQDLKMTFNMCADATQMKNNPNRLFE